MAEHSGDIGETPSPENELGRKAGSEAHDGLRMAPELMLDLARRAAEILVERIEGLPKESAWEGDFQQILADKLMEGPPEQGRPAAAVLERAGPDVLGEQLFGPWAVPFEIASVVLLVALLGALILARRTEGES